MMLGFLLIIFVLSSVHSQNITLNIAGGTIVQNINVAILASAIVENVNLNVQANQVTINNECDVPITNLPASSSSSTSTPPISVYSSSSYFSSSSLIPIYTGVQATNNIPSSYGLTIWTGMTTIASYAIGNLVQVTWTGDASDYMQGCVMAVGTSPLSISVNATLVSGSTTIPWTPWIFSLINDTGCLLSKISSSSSSVSRPVSSSGLSSSSTNTILTPCINGYDVIAGAGQSNMAAMVDSDPAIDVSNNYTFMWTNYNNATGNTAVIGADPMWNGGGLATAYGSPLVGPMMSAARAYYASGFLTAGRCIMLVNTALAGSSIVSWTPYSTSDLFTQSTFLIHEALQYGPNPQLNSFKMILWLQGETDMSNGMLGPDYENNLINVINGYRFNFSMPRLPFVITSTVYGAYYATDNTCVTGTSVQIDAAQMDIPTHLNYTFYIKGIDLTTGCGLHYDASDIRLTGAEMITQGYVNASINNQAYHHYYLNAFTLPNYTSGASSLSYLSTTLSTIVSAYSVTRKLRSAYGGYAFMISNVDGSRTRQIGFVGSIVDVSSVINFDTPSSAVYVTVVYDQSTNGHDVFTATTIGNSPMILLPTYQYTNQSMLFLYFNGTSSLMQLASSGLYSVATPLAITMVVTPSGGGGYNMIYGTYGDNYLAAYPGGVAMGFGLSTYDSSSTLSITTPQVVNIIINSTLFVAMHINALPQVVIPTIASTYTSISVNGLGGYDGMSYLFYGRIYEFATSTGVVDPNVIDANSCVFYGVNVSFPSVSSSSAPPSISSSFVSSSLAMSSSSLIPPVYMLDQISSVPAVAYGLRRLSSIATHAIQVCSVTTTTTCADIGFTTNGDLNVAQLLSFASGVPGGNVAIATLYDQSIHLINATNPNIGTGAPVIVSSNTVTTLHGIPYIPFTANANGIFTIQNGGISLYYPKSFSFVLSVSSSSNGGYNIFSDAAGYFDIRGNFAQFGPGNTPTYSYTAVDNQFQHFEYTDVLSPLPSPILYLQGLNCSTSPTIDVYSLGYNVQGIGGKSGYYFSGYVSEVIFFPNALDSTQQSILEASTSTYYAIVNETIHGMDYISPSVIATRTATPIPTTVTGGTPVVAYSLRQAVSSPSVPCVRLSNLAGSMTQDIGFVNGQFDITAYNAFVSIAGSPTYVTIWYDQSVNHKHATLSVSLNSPILSIANNTGTPVIWFTGLASFTTPTFPINNPIGIIASYIPSSTQLSITGPPNTFSGTNNYFTGSGAVDFLSLGYGYVVIEINPSSNVYNASSTHQPGIFEYYTDGGGNPLAVYMNGQTATYAVGSAVPLISTTWLNLGIVSDQHYFGYINEFIIISSPTSTTSIYTNIHNYYPQ